MVNIKAKMIFLASYIRIPLTMLATPSLKGYLLWPKQWIIRQRFPVSSPELAAEGGFSKLTLTGADRQSPCMTYRL